MSRVYGLVLPVLTVAGCASAGHSPRSVAAQTCEHVTVGTLAESPREYEGRTVCVSGYLGRMVPYGEEDAELFSTREQAEAKRADYYLHIGLRLTLDLQPKLAAHGLESVVASGVFHVDPSCWPQTTSGKPATCFSLRPMRVSGARVILADGTSLP